MIFRKRLSPTARANKWLDWMDEGVGEELIQEIDRYPKTITESNVPLLHVAILANRYTVADRFLQGGANPNLIDQYGQTPLLLAAEKEYGKPFVELLIDHHAAVNVADRHGASPIMYAAKANRAGIVSILLEASADPNHRDVEGDTVLMYAVTSGNPDLVLLLLDAGADPATPNFDGLTAYDKCSSETIRLLLREG